ncbi:MAG: hypothetical protein HC781_02425 [Leptolyngbyaceae cyanobacterium CSU_1_4]|nr:hypothetical protein [Leptolyngbyaceae cyanobacterium CSU_1_4]
MPTFKQTPASIRYLKARLKILKRPLVWVTASGLILSIFWVREYLANPQQYTGSNDPDAAAYPPNQNPLGNLPTQNMPASNSELFETLPDISTAPLQSRATLQTRSTSQSSRSDSSRAPLLQEFLLGRSSTPAQKDKAGRSPSSFLTTPSASEKQRDRPPESQVPNLYSPGSPLIGLSGSPSSDVVRSRLASPNDTAALNPLQSALNRYSSTETPSSLPSIRSLAQPWAAPSEASRFMAGSLEKNALGSPESSPLGLPNPQFVPQLSPSPGTTGYTLPPSLQTAPPTVRPSFPSNLQPIPGQIVPQTNPVVPRQLYDGGQPSYPTGQAAYPEVQPSFAPSAPMPSPFSVPRAVPGRSIGGGQINTFSNP